MNIKEAKAFLEDKRWQGSKPGLERISELLRLMGNPQNELRIIHVAGTNGKGSTCAMTESILRKSGYGTGMYASPGIYGFSDRILLDGEPINDQDLAELVTLTAPLVESMEDSPTEFELVTAMSLLFFRNKKCDYVILEVGMGGTWDATNAIGTPLLAVITSISIDHVDWLGSTIEEIAAQKAGIIKEGCQVISYMQKPKVKEVLEKRVDEIGAESLIFADNSSAQNIQPDGLNGISFEYTGKALDDFAGTGQEKNIISLPFLAEYQVKNAITVLHVVKALKKSGADKINLDAIKNGLAETNWRGRLEVISKDPLIITDGSHNPEGIVATVQTINKYFADKRITVVMGALADKDVRDMACAILEIADCIYCTAPNNPRAMSPSDLAQLLRELSKEIKGQVEIVEGQDVTTTVNTVNIQSLGNEDMLLGIGSLYMVKDFYEAVRDILK